MGLLENSSDVLGRNGNSREKTVAEDAGMSGELSEIAFLVFQSR